MRLRQFTEWKQNLVSLKKAVTSEGPELRLRLRSHLQDLILKIEVYAVGFATAYDVNAPTPQPTTPWPRLAVSDRIVDDAYDGLHDAGVRRLPDGFDAFTADLLARRMSREGRFLQVYYKTGAQVDLVPAGSLASGLSTSARKWRKIEPDIGKMWTDFQKHRG